MKAQPNRIEICTSPVSMSGQSASLRGVGIMARVLARHCYSRFAWRARRAGTGSRRKGCAQQTRATTAHCSWGRPPSASPTQRCAASLQRPRHSSWPRLMPCRCMRLPAGYQAPRIRPANATIREIDACSGAVKRAVVRQTLVAAKHIKRDAPIESP